MDKLKFKRVLLLFLSLYLVASSNKLFADEKIPDFDKVVNQIITELEGEIASGALENYDPRSLIPSLLLLSSYSSQLISDTDNGSEQIERVRNLLIDIIDSYFTESRWQEAGFEAFSTLVNVEILVKLIASNLNLTTSRGFFINNFIKSLRDSSRSILSENTIPESDMGALITNWNFLRLLYELRDRYKRASDQAFNAMGEILTTFNLRDRASLRLQQIRTGFDLQYKNTHGNYRFSTLEALEKRAKILLQTNIEPQKTPFGAFDPVDTILAIVSGTTLGTYTDSELVIDARESALKLLEYINSLPHKNSGYALSSASSIRDTLASSPPPYSQSLILNKIPNQSEILKVIQMELKDPIVKYKLAIIGTLKLIAAFSDLSDQEIHGIFAQLLFSTEAVRDIRIAEHILDAIAQRNTQFSRQVMQSAIVSPRLSHEIKILAFKKLIEVEGVIDSGFYATKETMERVVILAEESYLNLEFALKCCFLLLRTSNELAINKLEQIATATITTLQSAKSVNDDQKRQLLIEWYTNSFIDSEREKNRAKIDEPIGQRGLAAPSFRENRNKPKSKWKWISWILPNQGSKRGRTYAK